MIKIDDYEARQKYGDYDFRSWDSLDAITVNEAISLWCGYVIKPPLDDNEEHPLEWYRVFNLLNDGFKEGSLLARNSHPPLGVPDDSTAWKPIAFKDVSPFSFIFMDDLRIYAERIGEKPAFLYPKERNGNHELKKWSTAKDKPKTVSKSKSKTISKKKTKAVSKKKATRKILPPKPTTDKGVYNTAHDALNRLIKKFVKNDKTLRTSDFIDKNGKILNDDIREVLDKLIQNGQLAPKTIRNWIREALKGAGVTLSKGHPTSKKKKKSFRLGK